MRRVRGLLRISLSYNILLLFSTDASIYVSFSPSYLYYGDNSAFTDFFRRYVILDSDSYAADTLVFRIILKDGKIMTPSEVWKIADVYMWGGNYFTEDDIIFLKKLSRYYNKSDLNRLENFSRTILLQ